MRTRLLRSLLVLAVLPFAVVLTSLDANAEPSVTVAVGAQGTLLDPTVVVVPVEITCAGIDVTDSFGEAALLQAVSKRQIAYGGGTIQSQVVCDGTPHPNSYLIWADPSYAPFIKGDASVSASVVACDATFTCASGNSGVQIIRLRRP